MPELCNRPRFKSTSYLAEITENSQEGVPVTFLAKGIPEVFDHDLVYLFVMQFSKIHNIYIAAVIIGPERDLSPED